ncbi:UDP-glucuronosyl/UDP-glucosyltransferase [Parasponia andersonii]|uniref:UDP-glucuronosyl/UDP-glucosyltransferase n=1 Tax=Parasponia andersonii TaxID=3476 RepID=A0A2P5BYS3_PARAD|nr:UDP-glucuronosyl/UDP-glucosyltransferase [Parasponia andersonii]
MDNDQVNPQSHATPNVHNPSQVEVVMVPLPAQGHLNQFLNLSRLISAYDIPVHFAGAAVHNRQAKLRVHGWNPNSTPNIHFHNFTASPFPSPPPDPAAPHKFPSHLIPSFAAANRHLSEPLGDLVRKLSSKTRRVIVVHDSVMASAVRDVVSMPNTEIYTFHTFPPHESVFPPEFYDFVEEQYEFQNINSIKIVEKPYMDLMGKILEGKRNWAIGPFNPVSISEDKASNDDRHICLKWLDKQEPNSVIYVSFGTTTALTHEQVTELAFGLEQSEIKFIWALRDADKSDIFNGGDEIQVRKIELPKGGFLSHCRWNSCMESITMGVPIGAWPMHSDQPRNAVLVTELHGIGTVLRDWAHRDDVARADTVANGVRELMASEKGNRVRKRAEELGGAVRESVAEGGASWKELDSFIAHIKSLDRISTTCMPIYTNSKYKMPCRRSYKEGTLVKTIILV